MSITVKPHKGVSWLSSCWPLQLINRKENYLCFNSSDLGHLEKQGLAKVKFLLAWTGNVSQTIGTNKQEFLCN